MGEARDGAQGTEAVHSVHGFGHFSQHGYFLYILLVRLMIKDSAKPIYICKQIGKTFIFKFHKYL